MTTVMMMIYRSKLQPPKASEVLVSVYATYGAGNRPICSICWSQLDYEWGKGHNGYPGLDQLNGCAEDEEWVDKTGESWLVWKEIQRCMNPDCSGANVFRYLPSKLSFGNPYHPEDQKTLKLKGADLRKYNKGEHDTDGIFKLKNKKGILEPMEIIPPDYEVVMEHEGKWAWVWPGELRTEIPDTWTLTDDWIKTRLSSKRYQEIKQWFQAHRVDLDKHLLEKEDGEADHS